MGLENSMIGIFKVSEEDKKSILPEYPEIKVSGSYVLAKFSENGKVEPNLLGLKVGDNITLGRSNPHGFNFDLTVSRKHVEIFINDDGPEITDTSANGTYDITKSLRKFVGSKVEKRRTSNLEKYTPNTKYALNVRKFELTRSVDNDGRELDKIYIENQTMVRELFIQKLLSGEIYNMGDSSNFVKILKRAHELANREKVYSIVGKGSLEVNPGYFRTGQNPINHRKSEAYEISKIAKRYNDPYAERFLTKESSSVVLKEIPEQFLPSDYGKFNNYIFYYPDSRAIPTYMNKINEIGLKIMELANTDHPNPEELVELIANQYQHGAIIRPFSQVNNSLFMNLANAQLKLLGFPAIPHDELDLAAQRMQPKNFSKYFLDNVRIAGLTKM